METDVFRWVITIGVPGLLAWVGKIVLDFLKHQQDRADASQQAFLTHMKEQNDRQAVVVERQAVAMEGALRAVNENLGAHTEASKENNRQLAILLQREEAEISLLQDISNEMKEARRGR